jgi:hypothetical protein
MARLPKGFAAAHGRQFDRWLWQQHAGNPTDGGEIYGLAEGHLFSLPGLLPTCFASIPCGFLYGEARNVGQEMATVVSATHLPVTVW